MRRASIIPFLTRDDARCPKKAGNFFERCGTSIGRTVDIQTFSSRVTAKKTAKEAIRRVAY
jgi:hypothetical protein